MENANSGNCPTQTLVDAYEMQDGSTPDPSNPYEGRDPRMGMTIAVNGDKWPDANPYPLEIYYGEETDCLFRMRLRPVTI